MFCIRPFLMFFFYRVKLKHFEKFQDTTEALAGASIILLLLVFMHYIKLLLLVKSIAKINLVISKISLYSKDLLIPREFYS